MRVETKRDIVATWFVGDTVEDASSFPQAGHDSSRKDFQAVYWRCVACFHATALRQAPNARHVLFTNATVLPTVDGVDMGRFLRDAGVEVVTLPIRHRLGKQKVATWNNQFYILDILEDLAARDDYDTVTVLDSDCVWVKPIGALLHDIDKRGILSLCIPYADDFLNNGATRHDMRQAASELAGIELDTVPHYSGGEIFAATQASVVALWRLAEPMWDRLVRAEPDSIKVFEEGQFLSIAYELLDVPVGTADAHCRRMWTALRLNNVSAEDVFSSRSIWHMPMEKKTGFADLFKVVQRPDSWVWTLPAPELFTAVARVMGLPRRNLLHWARQVGARVEFHLEGARGSWGKRRRTRGGRTRAASPALPVGDRVPEAGRPDA